MVQTAVLWGGAGQTHDPPAEFVAYAGLPLPLGAPVIVADGSIDGVISGRSADDGQRWRVTWFNRHDWRVEHKWLARSQFEVITSGAAENAASGSAFPA